MRKACVSVEGPAKWLGDERVAVWKNAACVGVWRWDGSWRVHRLLELRAKRRAIDEGDAAACKHVLVHAVLRLRAVVIEAECRHVATADDAPRVEETRRHERRLAKPTC